MIKKITLLAIAALLLTAKPSFAQNHSSASQTVNIQVAPSIQILINTLIQLLNQIKNNHGNGNGNGGNGNGNGWWKTTSTAGNSYTPDQEIIVRSNKEFIVSVKTMEGSTNSDVMLALVDNQTGGKAAQAFENSYAPIGVTSQDLLSNCAYGNERSFAVNYKTNAPKEQPLTKADIIYTATLP